MSGPGGSGSVSTDRWRGGSGPVSPVREAAMAVVAHSVERLVVVQEVAGSSPVRVATGC